MSVFTSFGAFDVKSQMCREIDGALEGFRLVFDPVIGGWKEEVGRLVLCKKTPSLPRIVFLELYIPENSGIVTCGRVHRRFAVER